MHRIKMLTTVLTILLKWLKMVVFSLVDLSVQNAEKWSGGSKFRAVGIAKRLLKHLLGVCNLRTIQIDLLCMQVQWFRAEAGGYVAGCVCDGAF